jgi:hypothetical protein
MRMKTLVHRRKAMPNRISTGTRINQRTLNLQNLRSGAVSERLATISSGQS